MKGRFNMSGKFIKTKRLVMPMLTAVIIASQFLSCGAVTQDELLTMLNNDREIEIEIPYDNVQEQEDTKEDSEEVNLAWEELGSLKTNQTLRTQWDNILGITNTASGKNGVLYVREDGKQENNNTLSVALHNKEFTKMLDDKDTREKLANAAIENYSDLSVDDESSAIYCGINGYFNLLPDEGVSNASKKLSRKEFMTMVMRSDTKVQDIEEDEDFTARVGESEYNKYAQEVDKDAFLNTENKGLTEKNYSENITKAEAVSLAVNKYMKAQLQDFDSSSIQLSDAKNGGNIAERNKYSEDKEYWRIAELEAGLQSEDGEITEDLYNPLALTVSKGILDSETEWDSTITKSEGVELVVEVARQCTSIKTYGCRMGTIEGSDGLVDADTVENTVEANAGAGYIPDGADKDFAMQEEAATQAEMEANGEVATPVGEFIEESVATVYSAAPQSEVEVEKDTKADTTTTKPETTKAKTTSTKTKETTVNITRYTNKKVSTYSKAGSGKKVKTLAKGTKIKLVAKATVKGKTYYKLSKSSGTQWVIGSALSKTKPKTTSATTGSSGSSSNTSKDANTSKNNSNTNSSKSQAYKNDSRYKKLPSNFKKKVDKIIGKYNVTYDELAVPWDLVGLETVEEWMNDGATWDSIVKMAERASGDYILE